MLEKVQSYRDHVTRNPTQSIGEAISTQKVWMIKTNQAKV
jgi:hypothetical protein